MDLVRFKPGLIAGSEGADALQLLRHARLFNVNVHPLTRLAPIDMERKRTRTTIMRHILRRSRVGLLDELTRSDTAIDQRTQGVGSLDRSTVNYQSSSNAPIFNGPIYGTVNNNSQSSTLDGM